jgi:predicted Zn-ribbon and HTH transcriptional regulator
MDSIEKVLKVLKDNTEPMKAGEIAEKAGLDKKDVDKAMKQLKADEKIISPKRCFWTAK